MSEMNPKLTPDRHLPSEPENKHQGWFIVISLTIILALGAFLRLNTILRSTFPVNDGGMFYTMIRDLQQNHYRLPAFTSYNLLQIPFAYPPLSFYSAALLNQFLKIDLLQIFRFYPLFFNLLSIPAFYFLCKEITHKDRVSLLATFFYAILPPGYDWLISGGGLTRSPAQTFFIISFTLYLVFLRTKRKPWFVLSVMMAALMTLHHIEYTMLLICSMITFSLFQETILKTLRNLVIYGAGLGLLTAPYWVTILRMHGLSTFLNALSAGGSDLLYSIFGAFILSYTSELFVTFVTVLNVLGFFYCLAKRDYKVPVWFWVVVCFDYRSINRSLLFPTVILAAIAIEELILPTLHQISQFIQEKYQPGRRSWSMRVSKNSVRLFLIYILLITFIGQYLSSLGYQPILHSLSVSELQAMTWVKTNTAATDSFLVMDEANTWSSDMLGEWFPALTERHSWTTIQGTEWLPDHNFTQEKVIYDGFKKCLFEDTSCLTAWASQYSITYNYLYITKMKCDTETTDCTNYMILELASSPDYKLVFENDDVKIFEKIDSMKTTS